ncbi:type II toxin-antitoxin system Rv0910 family toxin [Nocardia xishanensis]|uniref:type II toxin-antitoxin system Rv0910 family toxin n=1 Tax=Nocardia xishanensis TaxID=238964 RepID=UPI000831F595|nr:SRPBCC family protein [Nocardia xishanensis]
MARFEVTSALEVSPAQLYALIADTATWGDWFLLHDGFAEQPPEHIGVNTKLVQNIRMLGMTQRLDLTIAAFKPPMRLTLSGSSPAGVTCEFSFAIERSPGGCRLTIAGDFSGPVLTGQLAKVVEGDAQAQLTESMARLSKLTRSDAP